MWDDFHTRLHWVVDVTYVEYGHNIFKTTFEILHQTNVTS